MKLWDISPSLSAKTAVFPGDTPFERRELMSWEEGHHLQLSSMLTTLHLGAHADATNHYHKEGQGIEARELSHYLGACQVITAKPAHSSGRLYPQDVTAAIKCTRVLFRTDSFPDPDRWQENFASLSPELIMHLHNRGVKTVGLDTPSVDPADSKQLESHAALWRTQMAVLEGLVLSEVADGQYILVALPLKIAGGDAGPVRAILLSPDYQFA